ncbi:MAG TPA: FKBP-type peptidyl-prolyl cis-trans isomerase [Propionibacteriaceae bacterium]|nr:FKBP-type peptidyl-prolyl cis-trans isomerase [Propionibacteriaceae bacterium]
MRLSPTRALIGSGLGLSLMFVAACGADDPAPAASTSATPSASASASGSGTPSQSASPAKIKASTNLDKVTATGDYGKEPKLELDAPWAIDKTRSKVLKANNTGSVIAKGTTVEVNYAGFNARTGEKFDDSFSRGSSIAFNLGQVVPGFQKGLVGQHQGSRVLIAMPGSDGYDASGGNPQIDVQIGDTLIFVVDVVAVPLSGPEGSKVDPKAGLPTVANKDGTPVVSIPKSDPPDALQVQPLIKGNGRKVSAEDTITFDYVWQRWSDGKIVEQTYDSKPAEAPLSELLPGMVKGLTDQTVGSRVLLVIPPSEGYPDGNEKPMIDKGETLVMVVDLLFTQSG